MSLADEDLRREPAYHVPLADRSRGRQGGRTGASLLGSGRLLSLQSALRVVLELSRVACLLWRETTLS